jgi:DNA primase
MQDSDTTKYVIRAAITAEGIVERPDVVGAVFGQTEGLLGNDLDLRDLQKTGRIGRIDVSIAPKAGKSAGTITIPSSLDRIETAILAASLETIDRVGPCIAHITLEKVVDVRASKRKQIIEKAKYVLTDMFDQTVLESQEITEEVKKAVRIEEITVWGKDKLPAGPNVVNSDAIIIVEGRADVLTLLRYGIKNAIAVGGTCIPESIIPLCKEKTVTAFTDGDRGGELIIKELLQITDLDFVARAPDGKGVEDLVQKEIVTALRQKEPIDQAVISYAQETEPKRKIHDRGTKIRRKTVSKPPKVEKPENGSEFATHVKELSDTMGARLLDGDTNIIKEVPVRDLADSLKGCTDSIESVVFDGMVTQRILDIAAEKNVKYLVGAELGHITKHPTAIKVMTASSL